jgi:biotin transport system substrate-specific component
MSQAALVGGRRATLADQFITRTLATDVALVVGGAAVVAVAAQIAVPLWPVPITGQTFAVLVVASALGAVRGTLAMALYAVLGIVGLPIFSDASSGLSIVAGPTGGYIIGFVFSAALVGWIAERSGDRKYLGATLAFAAGTVVTFAFGLIWLSASLNLNLEQTLQGGLYPFIIGGIVKSLLAAAIIPTVWMGVTRSKRNNSTTNREL